MNWLFKEEPTHYSYDDLVRDGKTSWTGVRNPVAQKHLRAVKKGDEIFFYHTGDEKAVVAVDPVEASRLEVALEERRVRGVDAIQILHEPLQPGVQRSVQQVPVEA